MSKCPFGKLRLLSTSNKDGLEFRKCTRFSSESNNSGEICLHSTFLSLPRYFISTKLRGLSQNTAPVYNSRQQFLNSRKPSFKYFYEDEWVGVSFRKSPVAFSCKKARQRKLIEPLKITDPYGIRRSIRVYHTESYMNIRSPLIYYAITIFLNQNDSIIINFINY